MREGFVYLFLFMSVVFFLSCAQFFSSFYAVVLFAFALMIRFIAVPKQYPKWRLCS